MCLKSHPNFAFHTVYLIDCYFILQVEITQRIVLLMLTNMAF